VLAGLTVFAALVALYGAVAGWLSHRSITMPIVFVGVGVLLGPASSGILPISPRTEGVAQLAELTLAVLLFADASTLHLRDVRLDPGLPARLLCIGLPLSITAGGLLAILMFPREGWAFGLLLGAILAPTDAALGLWIFNNPRVPVRIRRALNVESGLNDGLATPFVTLFLALATIGHGHAEAAFLAPVLGDISLAVLAAVVVGLGGGWLLRRTRAHGWTTPSTDPVAILGVALAAYFGSLAIGGNGFIASFVGGLLFAAATRGELAAPTEFTETVGACLSLLVWGIFGAVFVGSVLLHTVDWRPVGYAILSLTVVRMLPTAIALTGARLRTDTVALMGWFGPRGLASVVFTLVAYQAFEQAGHEPALLVEVAAWTILLSVLAHGLTAQPLADWYARRLRATRGPLHELTSLPELRPRRHVLGHPAHPVGDQPA
jgi:NhaP-type Na+/H+ or K+/H+ antiporter